MAALGAPYPAALRQRHLHSPRHREVCPGGGADHGHRVSGGGGRRHRLQPDRSGAGQGQHRLLAGGALAGQWHHHPGLSGPDPSRLRGDGDGEGGDQRRAGERTQPGCVRAARHAAGGDHPAGGAAGFPVGGVFLMTDNPKVTEGHTAKVYGRAELGAPPMSVPHIDTRYIDGKKYVLFGPFATYSNKFLKQGSQLDLLKSTTKNNVLPMTAVGMENLDLVKYLVSQVMMTDEDRFNELKKYYPDAKPEDWRMNQGGQRVQIIKKEPGKPASLQFGTEIFASQDGAVTALLGASPGASTSPYIMLSLLEKAFPQQVAGKWNPKLHEIVKSYQQELSTNPVLLDQVRQYTSTTLGLKYTPMAKAANDETIAVAKAQ